MCCNLLNGGYIFLIHPLLILPNRGTECNEQDWQQGRKFSKRKITLEKSWPHKNHWSILTVYIQCSTILGLSSTFSKCSLIYWPISVTSCFTEEVTSLESGFIFVPWCKQIFSEKRVELIIICIVGQRTPMKRIFDISLLSMFFVCFSLWGSWNKLRSLFKESFSPKLLSPAKILCFLKSGSDRTAPTLHENKKVLP